MHSTFPVVCSSLNSAEVLQFPTLGHVFSQSSIGLDEFVCLHALMFQVLLYQFTLLSAFHFFCCFLFFIFCSRRRISYLVSCFSHSIIELVFVCSHAFMFQVRHAYVHIIIWIPLFLLFVLLCFLLIS